MNPKSTSASRRIPSFSIIDVRVSAATMEDLHHWIQHSKDTRERFLMVSQNLHSVYLQRSNESLRQLQQLADCVRIDGMPLVWFSKWLGLPISTAHRTGWMDWLEPFMREAQQGSWRIFYVGSEESVKNKAMQALRKRYSGISIDGVNGYFDASRDSEDSVNIIAQANASGADILLVGMGMPRQEQWILDHLDQIELPVILTCGACMDYVAGAQSIPPRWMGRVGLEWLYRLAADPKRMWFRYIVEPWFALGLFIKHFFSRRRD